MLGPCTGFHNGWMGGGGVEKMYKTDLSMIIVTIISSNVSLFKCTTCIYSCALLLTCIQKII